MGYHDYIQGNPGMYVIRNKNDNFVLDYVFATLPEVVAFALASFHEEGDTSDFFNEWFEEYEEHEFTWEEVFDKLTIEDSFDGRDVILTDPEREAFTVIKKQIFEIVREQYEVYGKELTYAELASKV
jgi:hypothetical protein